MIRQPATTGNNKNNMKVRMICAGNSITSNFEHAKPAEQAQRFKISPHSKTMPSMGHIRQTRSKRINRNIGNGEREKDKPTVRILGFNPFKTLVILPKQLDRSSPLASWTKTIPAKVGRSNQPVISQPNRSTTIPYFR